MAKWVYSFGDGKAEGASAMKNLLGGKGANLAEMANLGLPVPPGFTISTEVCTYFYANGQTYPAELLAEVEAALAHVGELAGRTSAIRHPLLSVRSGARASMPGMMDTVLNLGLNDATVEALAKSRRRRALRLGLLSPLHPDVFQRGAGRRPPHFEEILEIYKDQQGHHLDTDLTAEDWRQIVAELQGGGRARDRASPSRRIRSEQLWGAIGAVFSVLDEPARHHLSPPARHPGELGHGGQRPGHGVRQHGRDLGHRRGLHPQSRRPARTRSTASS